jgi:hypothetical protein
MTRDDLLKYLRSQGASERDDNELLTKWLGAHPDFKVEEPDNSIIGKTIPLALRVLPSVAGSAIGTAVGGPVGASAGGAIGGGAGEGLAQLYERFLGGRKAFEPGEIAASTAIGAIPFSGVSKAATPLRAIAGQALKGAALGGASSALEDIIGKGQAPDIGGAAASAAGGALLGGAGEALAKRLKAIRAIAEEAPKVATPNVIPPVAKTKAVPSVRVPKLAPVVPEAQMPDLLVGPGQILNPAPTSKIPPAKPIPADRIMEFPSVEKQPAKVGGDIADMMAKHMGFADQRRQEQGWARTEALSDRIITSLKLLKPGTTANAEEMEAYKTSLASILYDKYNLAEKIAAGVADAGDKLKFDERVDEALTLTANFRGLKAEAGRSLNILKKKARIMTLGDMEFIEKLSDLPQFANDRQKLANIIQDAGNDPVKQFEAWKTELSANQGKFGIATSAYLNSLLSGTKPSIHKMIGDTFTLATNLATTPLSALHSKVFMSGEEVVGKETMQQFLGVQAGFRKAVDSFNFVMKHGFSLHDVEALNFGAVHPELPGIVLNIPSRMLKGVTDFYLTLAQHQEMYASAYEKVVKGGATTPEQIKKAMADLIGGNSKESEAFYNQTKRFADRAVYLDKKGEILALISRLKNNPKGNPVIRAGATFLFPFVNIPGKILQRGLETTPLGFTMKEFRQGVGRQKAQAAGRAWLGTFALAPIAYLASNMQMSGDGPRDPAERAALEREGWQPHSIKIGDRWVNYQYFQPLSEAMSLIANGWEAFRATDQSDSAAERAMQTITKGSAKMMNSILDVSWFQTLDSLYKAISDPDRYGNREESSVVQSLMPASGLLRETAQAVDPTYRKPTGVVESVETIIPGLSKNVPARLDTKGQPVQRPAGMPILPAWMQRGYLAPTVSQEKAPGADPVAEMMSQVYNTETGKPMNLAVPRAALRKNNTTIALTPEQKNILEQALGQERQARLLTLTKRDSVPSEQTVRRILTEATKDVDAKALRLVKSKKPFTVDDLVIRAKLKRLTSNE